MPTASANADDLLQPGFMAIHGNRLESLRDLTAQWLAHAPLAPLENEVVLVQSNGIAQWFKQALARPLGDGGLGISAAVDVQLPGRFLWTAYRAVLGNQAPAANSAFDPERLVWRLLRLLPELVNLEGFAALRRYLGDDADGRKRYQLAERLADLYDQYQVHRGDWLDDWERHRDRIADPLRGSQQALPPTQRWQAELWRRLLADVGPQQRDSHRAAVHRRFLAGCAQLQERPAGLPRRIVVFGISSLPLQTLEALAALGKVCQVLLVVMNPCRQYWADIVEDRELLRAERRRHGGAALATESASHSGNPLLAAWGKQGRDYVRLLDLFDTPDSYRQRFLPLGTSIDLYEDPGQSTLLQQLQHDIFDLQPLPPTNARHVLAADDRSLRFHIAHSAQREVEILHDRLLALRDIADREGRPLQPRDILVMVPDVQAYAPHIEAVFGRFGHDDARYLPYSIADRAARGQAALLVALESILKLPDAACSASDLLGLLDAPALRRRFGLGDDELPVLRRWIHESGVRWGLHAQQREAAGLRGNDQNSWAFGLRRMLLGYAVGASEPWHGIDPYDEVGGLDAQHVGALALLLERVDQWWRLLAVARSPQEWSRRLRELLRDAFDAGDDADDTLRLERLADALDAWSEACNDAGLVEPVARAVVAETWLASVDQPRLSQRFGGGSVNFATLMPMRAIPFRVVGVLGMNDGDYPRSRPPLEFDLMARHGSQRPGDRSRRDDDRYLFLEALLSVREHLHVSWIGRSARDNDARPPSVLLGQLRDHLAAGWRIEGNDAVDATLDALTLVHPLQPFGHAYFDAGQPRYFSYASEWRDALRGAAEPSVAIQPLADPTDPAPIRLAALRGLLRHPVKQFFNARLKVYLEAESAADGDLEPFLMDALQSWSLGTSLLHSALQSDDGDTAITRAMQRARAAGQLPMHALATAQMDRLGEQARNVHARWLAECARWPMQVAPREIRLSHAGVVLEDWIEGLRANADGQHVRLHAVADGLIRRGTDARPKWHRLLGVWVEHLAAQTTLPCETRIIAADCLIVLPPLPVVAAMTALQALLDAWRSGMNAPLAMACKAGHAFLEARRSAAIGKKADPWLEAEKAYLGEVAKDVYLQRVWPDFQRLRDHGFEDELAIYTPLFDHAVVSGARA